MYPRAASCDFKAAVRLHGHDIQAHFANVKDGELGGDIGALRLTHLAAIEDELQDVQSEIEGIAQIAREVTGADPSIGGDDDEFIRLDAESAWHLSSFARTLRLRADELVESASRLESSAYFGWQNKLDADVMALRRG